MRLGSADALPLYGATTTGLKFTLRSLHGNDKDERTVTTACLETCWTTWLTTTDRFIRTDTRATHPGQEALCSIKRPNTFAQTCLLALSFFLAVGRRTYIFVHVEGRLVKTGLIGTGRSTRRPMSRVLDAVIFRSRWEWPEVVRIHQFIQNCLLYSLLKTMRTGDATDADCCQSNIAASTLNCAAEYPDSQYP